MFSPTRLLSIVFARAIGLISKKQLCDCSNFFEHFCAVFLHDYIVKLPETSSLHILWGKCRTCSSFTFFFTAAHFKLKGLFFSVFLFLCIPNFWTWQLPKLNALDKTDTETISAFRFVFIDSSIASQVAGDYAISRQKKKLELHLGVWSRENKSLPKFLVCIDNQIYTMRKLRY